ncbi:MAG: ATP-grasp domain-containing protein [Leptolyngbyaceae cyanobacterium bins.349]|nr:ATP-grasp domain-containing protein [Leptolyngbyaceae cyanobacterium bins.349]
MAHQLPIPKEQLFVWAFIPYRVTEQGLIGEFYDNPSYRQELANVFIELEVQWKWQPITLENMSRVVQDVAASKRNYVPVVLNYCDGFDEVDGYPGTTVVELLENQNVVFTGSDSKVFRMCDNKIRMKQAFIKAGVPTAAYHVIVDVSNIQGTCRELGTPLIVKPAIASASSGISLKSVVESDDQIIKQVQWLLEGQHSSRFSLNNIFVERFVSGREFTVFLIGSVKQANFIKIYPPVERVFHSRLPEMQRFLAHEFYWVESQSAPSPEPFCRYQLVEGDLRERLSELAKQAYCAVGGNGYARVDIRMDNRSGELFVLEVNNNCGISSKPLSTFDDNDLGATSVGTILHLAGISFAELMSEILVEALAKHSLPDVCHVS